jgi:hypothetical protein
MSKDHIMPTPTALRNFAADLDDRDEATPAEIQMLRDAADLLAKPAIPANIEEAIFHVMGAAERESEQLREVGEHDAADDLDAALSVVDSFLEHEKIVSEMKNHKE